MILYMCRIEVAKTSPCHLCRNLSLFVAKMIQRIVVVEMHDLGQQQVLKSS